MALAPLAQLAQLSAGPRGTCSVKRAPQCGGLGLGGAAYAGSATPTRARGPRRSQCAWRGTPDTQCCPLAPAMRIPSCPEGRCSAGDRRRSVTSGPCGGSTRGGQVPDRYPSAAGAGRAAVCSYPVLPWQPRRADHAAPDVGAFTVGKDTQLHLITVAAAAPQRWSAGSEPDVATRHSTAHPALADGAGLRRRAKAERVSADSELHQRRALRLRRRGFWGAGARVGRVRMTRAAAGGELSVTPAGEGSRTAESCSGLAAENHGDSFDAGESRAIDHLKEIGPGASPGAVFDRENVPPV